jgi:hypothetical protein
MIGIGIGKSARRGFIPKVRRQVASPAAVPWVDLFESAVRNDTEDRLHKNRQGNGLSNRVSPATKPHRQKEKDKKMVRQKNGRDDEGRSRTTPARAVKFFVPIFLSSNPFFIDSASRPV